jgi:hypothetical protein
MGKSELERRHDMKEALIDFIFRTHSELNSDAIYAEFYKKYGWCLVCDDDDNYCDCENTSVELEEKYIIEESSTPEGQQNILQEYLVLNDPLDVLSRFQRSRREKLQARLRELNLLPVEDEDEE